MKKKEIFIFLGLTITVLVLCQLLAVRNVGTPPGIHLDLSYQIDSINDIQYKKIIKTYQYIAEEVISKGMRQYDVKAMLGSKSIIESFRQPLGDITHVQHILLDDISNNGIAQSIKDSIGILIGEHSGLRKFVDSLNNVLPADYTVNSRILDEKNFNGKSELLFSGLAAMESSLLITATELIYDYAEDVGAKDVAFDPWPEIDGTARIDSAVSNFYAEAYNQIYENPYLAVNTNPLSTFSVDVDIAAYANVRRFLEVGFLPPADAVKIEELINYFNYDYPEPNDTHPVSITTEYADCPWNNKHNLLMIGLKGKDLNRNLNFDELPPNNLNFLIDVSGSMGAENKLPLVKASLKKLTRKLRSVDKVSIVVYAGAAGLVLPPTNGDKKEVIFEVLDKLTAGGSTAGGEGIKLAYKIAKENFIKKGNNRIIICTDGDFNVGPSRDTDMERLVSSYRDTGIYITCLGFGMGNYKDSKMEAIAENGNGNYAYIDSESEADYVLGSGFTGTLYTIAKDVKIQVEFNPKFIEGYRLIGYENRMLIPEDFKNDRVDAGDIGSGHTVTALYEIIPTGEASNEMKSVDPLKYQVVNPSKSAQRDEIGTVKFRYKQPDSKTSHEVVTVIRNEISQNPGLNFMLSSAVAEYGLLLRRSKHKENSDYESLICRAREASLKVNEAERWEQFVQLAIKAKGINSLY